MSTITVKFFARYAEQFGLDETTLDWQPNMDVRSLWLSTTNQSSIPDNLLCARNMDYCKLNEVVEVGDEIAFFPPVSGG